MDKMLYVAMTGARENMTAQKVHANNLANATTNGFKADLEQARSMRVTGDGHDTRVYSMSERPGTDTTSGTLIQTGRNLDIAIDGDGWIATMNSEGQEVYTRNGSLNLLSTGELVTNDGMPVLNTNGDPIVLGEASNVTIANDGSISMVALGDGAADIAVVDRIKFVKPEKGQIFKGQDGMMHANPGLELAADFDVTARAGYLESSNVNAVTELTSIISLSKQFEMQVKMMKTSEENSEKASTILRLS